MANLAVTDTTESWVNRELYKRTERILRALLRHRERYVRAWIAATGFHPTECVLVTWTEMRGDSIVTITSVEPRKGGATGDEWDKGQV